MQPTIIQDMLLSISENIRLMFEKESLPLKEFETSLRPQFDDEYISMISLANQSFQGQLVVGFPKTTVDDMLSGVIHLTPVPKKKKELVKAALGEILNTACGSFARLHSPLDSYEHLDISIPSVWNSYNAPFFCRSEGMSGQLQYHNGDLINVYLTITPYQIFEHTSSGAIDIRDFLGEEDLDKLLETHRNFGNN